MCESLINVKNLEMKELIDGAKNLVKAWYDKDTKRGFIKTEIWSASNQYPGRKAGSLTELYVLEGGEAKGTIIADHFNGVVVAYDKYHIIVSERRIVLASEEPEA